MKFGKSMRLCAHQSTKKFLSKYRRSVIFQPEENGHKEKRISNVRGVIICTLIDTYNS